MTEQETKTQKAYRNILNALNHNDQELFDASLEELSPKEAAHVIASVILYSSIDILDLYQFTKEM